MSQVWLYVMAQSSRIITWEPLSSTLLGLLHRMKGNSCRELASEVDVDGEGHVPFGGVGCGPSRPRTSSNNDIIEEPAILLLRNPLLIQIVHSHRWLSKKSFHLTLLLVEKNPLSASRVEV